MDQEPACVEDVLIKLTPYGRFVVYYIDPHAEEWEEIITIDAEHVRENDFGEFSELCEMFEKISTHLKPGRGRYFSVYRNKFGVDWFTTEVDDAAAGAS